MARPLPSAKAIPAASAAAARRRLIARARSVPPVIDEISSGARSGRPRNAVVTSTSARANSGSASWCRRTAPSRRPAARRRPRSGRRRGGAPCGPRSIRTSSERRPRPGRRSPPRWTRCRPTTEPPGLAGGAAFGAALARLAAAKELDAAGLAAAAELDPALVARVLAGTGPARRARAGPAGPRAAAAPDRLPAADRAARPGRLRRAAWTRSTSCPTARPATTLASTCARSTPATRSPRAT